MVSEAEEQRRKELIAGKSALDLANAKARLSAEDCRIVEAYFTAMQPYCRKASVAEYKRPCVESSPFSSQMGGQFVGTAAGAWPEVNGEYLEGVLQVNVLELPWVPERLQQFELVQFFAAWKDCRQKATYEDGTWLVKTYQDLSNLVLMEKPFQSLMEPKSIQWKLAEHEIPSYPDNIGIVDEDLERDFQALDDWWLLLEDKFPTSNQTKIGGWPKSQQNGVPDLDAYVVQIDSACNWQWFSAGVGFLFLDDNDTWSSFCDFD